MKTYKVTDLRVQETPILLFVEGNRIIGWQFDPNNESTQEWPEDDDPEDLNVFNQSDYQNVSIIDNADQDRDEEALQRGAIKPKIYAGIGSRETPREIMDLMSRIAIKLEGEGWLLRSGGAQGADMAFEKGVTNKQIIRPQVSPAWEAKARTVITEEHWGHCSPFAKKAHSRNAAIIFGENLDSPARFVCCWTRNAKSIGGTAVGINLALKNGIPVRNLGIPEVREGAERWLLTP